ncbi:hypothetical protein [Ruminococcus albus]|uniref:hypothetical protein n=1 Tax=Ruminococcus albus TaxID=1264 RepID=UPI0004B00338|nr:hypothetical protein [Ruminococcus albus]
MGSICISSGAFRLSVMDKRSAPCCYMVAVGCSAGQHIRHRNYEKGYRYICAVIADILRCPYVQEWLI